jgi:alkylhydroperoxidase family enzyme
VLAHSQMLRASTAVTTTPLDARSITDRSVDPLLPSGNALLDFVDAVLTGEQDQQNMARDAVVDALGPTGLVDAAGVIANFEMMNRIADATGMPVGKGTLKRTAEWRALIGIDRFNHL